MKKITSAEGSFKMNWQQINNFAKDLVLALALMPFPVVIVGMIFGWL